MSHNCKPLPWGECVYTFFEGTSGYVCPHPIGRDTGRSSVSTSYRALSCIYGTGSGWTSSMVLESVRLFLAFKPIFRNARRSAFLCPHHCGNSLLFRLLPYSNPILSKEHRDTLFQIPETLKLGKESS